MNIYLVIIIIAVIVEYLTQSLAKILNLQKLTPRLPPEFSGFYDAVEYERSQEYTRLNTRFSFLTSTTTTIVLLGFILAGGFNTVDTLVRGFSFPPLFTGLAFFGALFVLSDILSLPFSLYSTFVIEEKFGFNKMTLKTYFSDKLRGYLLVTLLGGVVLGGILYFFAEFGELAWLYAWGIVTLFTIAMPPLFTTFIAPLFNKFTPLPEGDLKEALAAYAAQVDFPLTGVFIMDGSKRSTKSNAYFTGFGKKKRIVLFDTLLEQHTTAELLGILAHEIGHYKRRHIHKGIALSILQTGLLFFLLSLFLNNSTLFAAFKMDHTSVYGSLLFFSLLYSPASFLLGVFQNILSRKHEYEADNFSATTLGDPEPLILGLKKLSVHNLGNLTPHPFSVFLNYSHPTVLQRIAKLRS